MSPEQDPNEENDTIRNAIIGGAVIGLLLEGAVIGGGVLFEGARFLSESKDIAAGLCGVTSGGVAGGAFGLLKKILST